MSREKRPYRLKERAESQERTRRRITEAAVELHGSVGPARTSISAIADRAGVQRTTVYRHFPDEDSLFASCAAHWAAANPPPDLDAWKRIADPGDRLRTGLEELYAYFRSAEEMLVNVIRDGESVEGLRGPRAARLAYIAAAREVLVRGRPERGRRRERVKAAVGHAIDFGTWRSLARGQGLDDAGAVELMVRFVAAASA